MKKPRHPPGTKMQPILQKMEEERIAYWRGLNKAGWIAAARAQFQTGEGESCEVCRRFSAIAQAHHLIPLGEQFDRGFATPNQRYAWLCPNHHAMVHHFMRHRDFRVMGLPSLKLSFDLSAPEVEAIWFLIRRSRGEDA